MRRRCAPAALLALLLAAPAAAQGAGQPPAPPVTAAGARVDLLVSDALSGRPLRGARVQLDGAAPATSDSLGQVLLDGVAGGHHRLLITAAGREPATPELELREGELLRLEVQLERTPVMLATLPVVATPRLELDPKLAPAPRPQSRGGRFYSRAELTRMGVVHLGELVVRLQRLGGSGGRLTPPTCLPRVVADGMEITGGLSTFPVQDLEAVELYSSATVPAEYGGSASSCGLIVVWTRHG